MYEIIKNVIAAGGFKLADIQHKIKKLYVMGDITEEQLDELLQMASGGVSTDAERPETLAMMKNLSERMDGLEARLKALEDGTDEIPGADPEAPAYEAWEPWDGISNKYQPGAIVSHNGKLWRTVYNGQNVWEPGAAGTASLWAEYSPDAEEPAEEIE